MAVAPVDGRGGSKAEGVITPGLYDYICGVLAGLSDKLETPLRSLICDRIYFHFLEMLAIVREHEQIEALEKLWERGRI